MAILFSGCVCGVAGSFSTPSAAAASDAERDSDEEVEEANVTLSEAGRGLEASLASLSLTLSSSSLSGPRSSVKRTEPRGMTAVDDDADAFAALRSDEAMTGSGGMPGRCSAGAGASDMVRL